MKMKQWKTRVGRIVVAGLDGNSSAFVFCDYGRLRVDKDNDLTGVPYAGEVLEEYWLFLDAGLRRYRGITETYMTLYFEEQAFRFNHRGQDMYTVLARILCGFVPEDKLRPARFASAGPQDRLRRRARHTSATTVLLAVPSPPLLTTMSD